MGTVLRRSLLAGPVAMMLAAGSCSISSDYIDYTPLTAKVSQMATRNFECSHGYHVAVASSSTYNAAGQPRGSHVSADAYCTQ